jgi:hypothetical protein
MSFTTLAATESFGNNDLTTLEASMTALSAVATVASVAGFPTDGQFRLLVDSELMLVTGYDPIANQWQVTRGIEGTTAATHSLGAQVVCILTRGALLNIAPVGLVGLPSWLIPNWWIDPVGGSDTNNGTSTLTPLRTWKRLTQLWGTVSPVLNQNTTITFLSAHDDNSDPVVFTPITAFTVAIVAAAPTVVTSGVVLASVTPKSTVVGSNSLLIADLGATAAVGQLVQNTTLGKESRAWVYANISGTIYSLTQPLTLQSVGSPSSTNVDTWGDGDTVDLLTPIAVNISLFGPNFTTSAGAGYLFQITCLDPAPSSLMSVGPITLMDCFSYRQITAAPAQVAQSVTINLSNVYTNAGCDIIGGLQVTAGGGNVFASYTLTGQGSFQNDHIFGGWSMYGGIGIAQCYLDNSIILVNGSIALFGILYGSLGGGVELQGSSRFALVSGSFTSAFTAPALIAPGIVLNGSSFASSHTNASPDVFYSGIQTTPAHLDAPAGAAGFGGTAFRVGGSSCSTSL